MITLELSVGQFSSCACLTARSYRFSLRGALSIGDPLIDIPLWNKPDKIYALLYKCFARKVLENKITEDVNNISVWLIQTSILITRRSKALHMNL